MKRIIEVVLLALIFIFPSVRINAMESAKVEISASDFVISLEDAKALTAEIAKDENHAAIILLNQVTREYAIPFVTVDELELETINNATIEGEYFLTFRINHNSYQDEKTITVTILNEPLTIMPINIDETNSPLTNIGKIFSEILFIIFGGALVLIGVFLIRKYKK